jgi:hypothetical protein
MDRPDAGWVVHYHTFNCDPADLWGVVLGRSQRRSDCFIVRMCDTGEIEFTEYIFAKLPHCTVYRTPPDEFHVWIAKRALLNGLTSHQ